MRCWCSEAYFAIGTPAAMDRPDAIAALTCPARFRYQSLGSRQPSASSVTTCGSIGTVSVVGASLNIAVPSSTSSNIAL
jgi:hypothetical protein